MNVDSSSPSSEANASTSLDNFAALTKRTRTVSHSRCDISSSPSSDSFCEFEENFITDESQEISSGLGKLTPLVIGR